MAKAPIDGETPPRVKDSPGERQQLTRSGTGKFDICACKRPAQRTIGWSDRKEQGGVGESGRAYGPVPHTPPSSVPQHGGRARWLTPRR